MQLIRRSRPVIACLILLILIISACSAPITSTQDGSANEATAPSAAASVAEPTTETSSAPSERATSVLEAEGAADETPTTATATEPPDEDETTTAEATEGGDLVLLDEQYRVDSDGNAIPDFIETELGLDPNVDDCALQECGIGVEGTGFLTDTNVLLLFDSSGSMAASIGTRTKIETAKQNIRDYVSYASVAAKVGLLVYGHKGNNTEAGKAESCAGIELLAPLGQVNGQSIGGVLDQFQPTGWTPIAGALEKSQEAFAGTEGQSNRIILVSDGIETCDGDPVAVARKLYEEGLNVQVDVIGYDLREPGAVEQMQAIAAAGGGKFFDARTEEDFSRYFDEQRQAIYDTVDAALCQLNNAATTMRCDQQQVNKARNYLFDRINEVRRTNKPLADAYRALADEIKTKFDERQALRRDAADRYREEAARLEELRRQLREAAANR